MILGFKGVLNIADTVTAVNGKTFDNSADLIKYVQGLKLGSKVKVTYTTDDKEKTATGKIIKIANGKNGIGIGLTDHTEVKSPENVKFKLDGRWRTKCGSYVYPSYLRSGIWSRPQGWP